MMRGASTVLQTLVPNARQIFKVLADAQLEDDDEYEGAAQPLTLFQAFLYFNASVSKRQPCTRRCMFLLQRPLLDFVLEARGV